MFQVAILFAISITTIEMCHYNSKYFSGNLLFDFMKLPHIYSSLMIGIEGKTLKKY